jgi:hypothetical protein
LIKNLKSTPNLRKADEIEKSSGTKNLSRKIGNLENTPVEYSCPKVGFNGASEKLVILCPKTFGRRYQSADFADSTDIPETGLSGSLERPVKRGLPICSHWEIWRCE